MEANHFIYIGGLYCITRDSDRSHGLSPQRTSSCGYLTNSAHEGGTDMARSISSTRKSDDPVKNQIASALVDRILLAARNGEKFKVG